MNGGKNVNFVYSDYREFMKDDSNVFDAIFSVEMVEAIGRNQLETYFDVVSRLLKENKRFVIQFIGYNSFAFPPQYSSQGGSMPTFVTKYIFPSGFIPLPDEIIQVASNVCVIDIRGVVLCDCVRLFCYLLDFMRK